MGKRDWRELNCADQFSDKFPEAVQKKGVREASQNDGRETLSRQCDQ